VSKGLWSLSVRDAARAQSAAPTAVARVHPAAAGARPCSTSRLPERGKPKGGRAGPGPPPHDARGCARWATAAAAGPGQSTVDAVTSELYTLYSAPFSQSMCSTAPYFSQSMLYCPLASRCKSML
jgi:hypothetical protein